MIDLSDAALAAVVDQERYLWRDDPSSQETMWDRAARAHWRKVNDLAPEWLRDQREWEDLPREERDHHREVVGAVIEAAGGPRMA